jgi:hypothetical protein
MLFERIFAVGKYLSADKISFIDGPAFSVR